MIKKTALSFLFFIPTLALAASSGPDLGTLAQGFTDAIWGSVVPLLFSLCFLVFLWGIAKFISNAGDAKTHQDGKMMMIWGLVGLFVMVSYLAILRAAHNDVGFNGPFGQPIIDIKTNQ